MTVRLWQGDIKTAINLKGEEKEYADIKCADTGRIQKEFGGV